MLYTFAHIHTYTRTKVYIHIYIHIQGLHRLGVETDFDECKQMFDEVDEDGSGLIDFLEFCRYMCVCKCMCVYACMHV
jgi:hypothetical protein